MILIIATEDDFPTNDVCDWLFYLNKPFIRVSNKSTIGIKKMLLSNKNQEHELEIDNGFLKKNIYLSEIKTIWFRRSNLSFNYDYSALNLSSDASMNNAIRAIINSEEKNLVHFLWYLFKNKKHINNYYDNDINKLDFLNECIQLDIKIPPTLVTNNKSELITFLKLHKSLITKALGIGHTLEMYKTSLLYYAMTQLIETKDLESIPDAFYPSLFQKNIEKMFEIRSFYLDGAFYSSVIFSQNNPKTKIDFRNYDEDKPNRVVPYSLPNDLKLKLKKLMQRLRINSGSFDIIYSLEEEYIVLEVNPIGQYDQVSIPCNYNLDLIIANEL